MLASPKLGEQGRAKRSSDGEIPVLKFEELPSLVPEIQRSLGLAELTLSQRNLSRAKTGATIVLGAVQSMMKTLVGSACVRELLRALTGLEWARPVTLRIAKRPSNHYRRQPAEPAGLEV